MRDDSGDEWGKRCDRSYLAAITTSYLEALKAHDPKRLVVRDDVRFTENGAAIPLGESLWATVCWVRASCARICTVFGSGPSRRLSTCAAR